MAKTRNKLLAAFAAAIIMIAAAVFVIPSVSSSAAWDGIPASGFAGGDGTTENTAFQISNGAELAYLAQEVNKGTTYAGVYFKLTANIELGGSEWTPIGYSKYDKNESRENDNIIFAGIFDGQGYTISNLTISEDGNSGKHSGLFGYSSGTIKNLYLENAQIKSYNGIGGICDDNSGTIEACGVNSGELKVSGANGGNVGGICETNSGTVSKCYNMADIIDGSENGGICAINNSGATIENCYNGGKVAAASGISNGGICAKNSGTLQSCLNFGKLSSESENGRVYGICGNGTGTMSDCYNDSSVNNVNVSGFGANITNAVNKTTSELCNDTALPEGLESGIWNKGSLEFESVFDDNFRAGTLGKISYTYPSLSGIGTTHQSEGTLVYDFGSKNGGFQEYTLIEDEEAFVALGQNSTGWDKNYVLAKDIDLAGRTDVMPIGNSDIPFTGKFSGNGHTIINAEINKPEEDNIGLFGVNNGLITQISIENAKIVGRNNVGGVCGSNEGTIYKVAFVGTVQGTEQVGGICGVNKGYIELCYSIGDVAASDWVGGICGYSVDLGEVGNCYSVCKVSGSENASYIGSISGENWGTIQNCRYSKAVSGAEAIGKAMGNVNNIEDLLLSDLVDNIGISGFTNGSYTENINGKFRAVTYTYPSIGNVGAPYTAVKNEYNFGVDGTADWDDFEYIDDKDGFLTLVGDSSLWGKNYVLNADIDLGGAEITPIGNFDTPFTGKFSGNGHVVSNFKINMPNDNLVGLFGKISGLIMDLGVENAEVTGNSYVGGVCGAIIDSSTIINCYNTGTVSGAFQVGGVCGSSSTGIVENCYNTGAVSGEEEVGGVCGNNYAGNVENCYNTGAVSGNSEKVGGVCGYNYGALKNCYNTAVVNGETKVGGICGKNSQTIENCASLGVTWGTQYIGGICGTSDTTVENCYNIGDVIGGLYIGGVCGELSGGTLENCYSVGKVSGGSYTTGSIVGNKASGDITNCYYDKSVSGIGAIGTSDGSANDDEANNVKSLTAAELCSTTLPTGFDSTDWAVGDVEISEPDGKFRTVTYTYPSLNGVGTAYSAEKQEYNFKISSTDADDWQGYELIENEAQFIAIGENSADWGKNYVLGANIDLGGAEITPIGDSDYTVTFTGKFDGAGHIVSNFKINKPDGENVGLFGRSDGLIMNLGVEKAQVTGKDGVGGVCGANTGTITNCYNICEVSGKSDVGGVCGGNDGTITNCYNTGAVSAASGLVGGVCGSNGDTITNCYNTSAISGYYQIGGVCGYNYGTVTSCYNTGAVSGSNDKFGGVCGSNGGTITNCYNTGTVSISSSKACSFGGVCGYNGSGRYNTGTITNCYNTGAIMNWNNTAMTDEADRVGSVCGSNEGTITNCYYDKDVSSLGAIGASGGSTADDEANNVKGLTTVELCGGELPTGFDSTYWTAGKIEALNTSGRFRTAAYVYPSLNGVGTAYSVEKQEYNFKADGEDDVWAEYTFIESEAQFIAIGNDSTSWGKNYVLKKDLNLSGKTITPIGSSDTTFTGKFSGNGYTISNVKMSTDEDLSGGYGLFGTNTGLIMNLAVEGDISYTLSYGHKNVGGICGENAIGGEIYCCSFEGKVYNGGNGVVGGICGENTGLIEYCYAFADVTSDKYYAGGICGNSGNSLSYCYFVGNVNGGSDKRTGAIVGQNQTSTNSYSDCYYDKERCNASNIFGTGLTTKELCENSNLFGLKDASIWTTGSYLVTPDAENSKFRTVEYTYPNLVCMKKAAKSGDFKQYNFKTGDTDDWQECTIITTAEQFKAIVNDSTSWSKNYVLGANINLGGAEITPIGYGSTPFTGKFSGGGHIVSNFEINKPEEICVGLFGYNKGLIMNVGVEKAEINGYNFVGGVCGFNLGTVMNCYNAGTVSGDSDVGGVCGLSKTDDDGTNTAIVANCYNTGTVSGDGDVGGVCGSNDGTVTNCYNTGAVSGTGRVGGVCGSNINDGVITNCYNTGAVSGKATIGGVCGINNTTGSTIKNCYNTGTVSGTTTIGSVCGGNVGTIENCYYNKDVSSLGAIGEENNASAADDEANNVKGLTTAELCGETLPTGFDIADWTAGKVEVTALDGRFRTAAYVYPSLNGVGTAYSVENEEYNFKTDGADDWQEYTLISTEAQLKAIGNNDESLSKNYVLEKDITLSGEFTPIGWQNSSGVGPKSFIGKFSGNGYTISGVNINRTGYCAGLFGGNRGLIMNLSVKGEVNGQLQVGGISGSNVGGVIFRCSFEGKVSGGNNVGGISGFNGKVDDNNIGTIKNCYAVATIIGERYVGGISNSSHPDTIVENCYFAGEVTAAEGGVHSPIDSGSCTITNCYYNKDLCDIDTTSSAEVTGLTTVEMTSADALEKMGFDRTLWTKKVNNKANGIAYYPSFADNSYAPSVKYTTELEFTKVGNETPVYGDNITFSAKALLKIGDIVTEDTAGEFSIRIGSETVVTNDEFSGNTAVYTAKTAGRKTFTLAYKNGNTNYFPDELTKNLVVTIEKLTLTVDDFEFTPPTNLIFDGKAKSASFSGKSGVGEITAKYYLNGVETQPINAGDYTVKIDVAEGDIYKSATDLTSADWTFTIEKATAPAVKVNEASAPWNKNGSRKFTITGLPENHGGFIGEEATVTENSDNIIGNTASFSDGVLTYTLNKLTAADLGKTATVELEIETKNYTTFSVTVEITVTKMTLVAPTNVRVRSDDGQLVISWSAVENAEFYRVQWLDGTVWRTVGQTKNLSYGVKSVVSGETYTYRVLAGDESSYGPASASASATYSAVPKNVKATAENKRVTLTWDKVSSASEYRVQMLKNGVWTTVGTPAANTLVVKNLANGTKYSFRVLAKSGGAWSIASAVVTATPSLIPTNVSAAAGNESVTLTWDKLNEASEYRVQMLKNNVWTTIALPTANTYTVKNLTNGTTYSFRVLANVDGKWSVASIVVTAKPDLIPANFRAVVAGKSMTLRWTALSGATRYRIQRLNDNTWTTIGYASGTSFVDKNVESGKSYSYRILCFDGTAWHTPSAAITGSMK